MATKKTIKAHIKDFDAFTGNPSDIIIVLKRSGEVLDSKKVDGNGTATLDFDFDDNFKDDYTIELSCKGYRTVSHQIEEHQKKAQFELVQDLHDIHRMGKMDPVHTPIAVKLTPSSGEATDDQLLWKLVNKENPKNLTEFNLYKEFIDNILGGSTKSPYTNADQIDADKHKVPFTRAEAYSLLKYATERYVAKRYSVEESAATTPQLQQKYLVGPDNLLPYISSVEERIQEFFSNNANLMSNGVLQGHSDVSLIELIWSYWHEEGMLDQTMQALVRRFQNIKNGYNDPLANFELDALRPLNNILWGFIQDGQHRLSIVRRNYEYEHQYGLRLSTINVPGFNPADRRLKFLQSFHKLIYESTEYFIQSDNTIIRPDGFKLLNALRDTHRILAEGAHNQFGDLPTVARTEMLMTQWILSRSEIREFLGGRTMVPYEEPWMDRVDSMKALQGWDNTSVSFYRDLAVYGEKIILSIRYGDWSKVTRRDAATNWADAFRDAIQRYIHSYYTVTGIDLAAQNVNINPEEKYLMPGTLIQQKLMRAKSILRR